MVHSKERFVTSFTWYYSFEQQVEQRVVVKVVVVVVMIDQHTVTILRSEQCGAVRME